MSLVPMVIEKTSSGERSFDIYSRLLRDRIVMLTTKVDEHSASLIVSQLLYLESEGDGEINLFIHSPGGHVDAGMAIIDVMNFIKPDVSTTVIGQAASMGSLIATSGTPGKRFMLPNSRHMCHQPSGGASGMASDIEIQANEILKLKRILTDIYVRNNSANKTFDDFAKIMDRDTYLSASEAVDFGLADAIVTKRGEK